MANGFRRVTREKRREETRRDETRSEYKDGPKHESAKGEIAAMNERTAKTNSRNEREGEGEGALSSF